MTVDIHRHTERMQSMLQRGEPFAVVTLVAIRGSAPQVQGAKAIVDATGIVEGTVGGGKVEARAIAHAQELLEQPQGRFCDLKTWNLQTEIGMTCGGEVTFFFELYGCSEWQIAVFGAGHVAQALVPLLLPLNCYVTCCDPREEWLERLPTHPRLRRLRADRPEDLVDSMPANAFFVVMTRGHATDLPILQRILSTRQPPFVGVLGSVQKAKILRRDLAAAGISQEAIDRMACPLGLPIGNNTPNEMAISIAAQLMHVRDASGVIVQKTKRFGVLPT